MLNPNLSFYSDPEGLDPFRKELAGAAAMPGLAAAGPAPRPGADSPHHSPAPHREDNSIEFPILFATTLEDGLPNVYELNFHLDMRTNAPVNNLTTIL